VECYFHTLCVIVNRYLHMTSWVGQNIFWK
jgi:hypothetical protein